LILNLYEQVYWQHRDIFAYNSVFSHRYICTFMAGWLAQAQYELEHSLPQGSTEHNPHMLLISSYHCFFTQLIKHKLLHIQSVPLMPKFLKRAHIARLGRYLLIIYYFRCLLFCKYHWASAVASDSWREQVLVIMGAFKRY